MKEAMLLKRISYGIQSAELNRLKSIGYEAYLKEQLQPKPEEDKVWNDWINTFRFQVAFNKNAKKVEEEWNFKYLNASTAELWALQKRKDLVREEKNRPAAEVLMATWLRAAYSKWQLQELVVDFWHNHFNISMDVNEAIPVLLPVYDREVIRKNCFGNFRKMLEAVAKNPCMLYYLDNALSKASPANENYARELFELHSLGAPNYLNHLYNRWKEVPGALDGNPTGYIDEDVYEAARAFTGWTVADGRHDDKGGFLPDTGEFYYFEAWHDNYQKRVLAFEFPPNQAPLADGLKVLDLVAYHPATARYICTKLCRRFTEDEPNAALVEEAAQLWINLKEAPDQIAQVLRFILTHKAFHASLGNKIKRPPELVFSFVRALGANFRPNQHLFWMFALTGYRFFAWPTPTGHPDVADYWLNSNMMLLRWNMMQTLLEDWHKMLEADSVLKQTPSSVQTCGQFVDFWSERFFGIILSGEARAKVVNFLAAGGVEEEAPFGDEREVRYRMLQSLALLGMLPEFQFR